MAITATDSATAAWVSPRKALSINDTDHRSYRTVF